MCTYKTDVITQCIFKKGCSRASHYNVWSHHKLWRIVCPQTAKNGKSDPRVFFSVGSILPITPLATLTGPPFPLAPTHFPTTFLRRVEGEEGKGGTINSPVPLYHAVMLRFQEDAHIPQYIRTLSYTWKIHSTLQTSHIETPEYPELSIDLAQQWTMSIDFAPKQRTKSTSPAAEWFSQWPTT